MRIATPIIHLPLQEEIKAETWHKWHRHNGVMPTYVPNGRSPKKSGSLIALTSESSEASLMAGPANLVRYRLSSHRVDMRT